MYRNRIRRTASKTHPKLRIPLSDFRVDPRARYVESVCAVLIESRFGWSGSIEPWWDDNNDLEELPEVDPRQLYDDPFDLMPECRDEAAVFDDGVCILSQGRKVSSAIFAALRETAFCFTQRGKESSGTRGSPRSQGRSCRSPRVSKGDTLNASLEQNFLGRRTDGRYLKIHLGRKVVNVGLASPNIAVAFRQRFWISSSFSALAKQLG